MVKVNITYKTHYKIILICLQSTYFNVLLKYLYILYYTDFQVLFTFCSNCQILLLLIRKSLNLIFTSIYFWK